MAPWDALPGLDDARGVYKAFDKERKRAKAAAAGLGFDETARKELSAAIGWFEGKGGKGGKAPLAAAEAKAGGGDAAAALNAALAIGFAAQELADLFPKYGAYSAEARKECEKALPLLAHACGVLEAAAGRIAPRVSLTAAQLHLSLLTSRIELLKRVDRYRECDALEAQIATWGVGALAGGWGEEGRDGPGLEHFANVKLEHSIKSGAAAGAKAAPVDFARAYLACRPAVEMYQRLCRQTAAAAAMAALKREAIMTAGGMQRADALIRAEESKEKAKKEEKDKAVAVEKVGVLLFGGGR